MAATARGLGPLGATAYEWQPLSEDHALPFPSGRTATPRKVFVVGFMWYATSAVFSTWANTAFLRCKASTSIDA